MIAVAVEAGDGSYENRLSARPGKLLRLIGAWVRWAARRGPEGPLYQVTPKAAPREEQAPRLRVILRERKITLRSG